MSNPVENLKPVQARKVQEELDAMLKRRDEEDKLIAASRAKLRTFNKAQEHKLNSEVAGVLREYAEKDEKFVEVLAVCLYYANLKMSKSYQLSEGDAALIAKYPQKAPPVQSVEPAKVMPPAVKVEAPAPIATPAKIAPVAPVAPFPVKPGPAVVVVGSNTKPVQV